MSTFYVPGQFRNECEIAIRAFQAVSRMLDLGQVDAADTYMSQVMKLEGERIYETVLAMVAASRQIPPKDVSRP
ncbi:hypothetical protein C8D88_116157 [Lentzea atacamensis]|uniref:Uncharacterized protein n=1 Tax=Lentzea atacamensis TaxID=531938 RepID=A0A316HM02_9PSEU|nr:hypothetical protein [Lentzea atacamensis]PWK81745.1 hypothetical protein C8D88_116157 [Lentzea atacamensis]